MKLLVIVLCLLSERFLIHSLSYQRFNWFGDYVLYIKKQIENHVHFVNPWGILITIIAPVILMVSFVFFLLHSIFFGFVGFLLNVAIFFYCLGPQNAFYPITEKNAADTEQDVAGNYFSAVNNQLFAVVFWYILAGPIAVLTYRLISLCSTVSGISHQASQVSNLLEWIPARITALLFLLAGNFQRGFSCFKNYFLSSPGLNDKMLRDCGLQAAKVDDSEVVPMPVAEGLVEHAAIVLLVFIALFTLIAWL